MQKARRQALRLRAIALRPLVGRWFQVQCPPLVGVLPIVRSRYWSTIGRQGVLSLAGGTPQIHACFHVTGATQVPHQRPFASAYGTITRFGRTFQNRSANERFGNSCALKPMRSFNPQTTSRLGLGSGPFARRYSGRRGCFLFLQVLRCFSSLGWHRVSRAQRAFGRSPGLIAVFHALAPPGAETSPHLPLVA